MPPSLSLGFEGFISFYPLHVIEITAVIAQEHRTRQGKIREIIGKGLNGCREYLREIAKNHQEAPTEKVAFDFTKNIAFDIDLVPSQESSNGSDPKFSDEISDQPKNTKRTIGVSNHQDQSDGFKNQI